MVFVGDGPDKETLLALARTASAATRVHFLPFANQTEMPARLLLADVFVLPSRGHYETWGLAVNEAMHMGVPALVSDLVGCQRDLVTEGETGWVFRADDTGALQTKLGLALDTVADLASRERLRRAVMQRISGYTYAQTTSGLLAALALLPAPSPA
jgi:glycosyltransferase involved in cell wall biosynthesis